MPDSNLAFAILNELDIAVLKRVAPREYVLLGGVPAFYDHLFPPTDSGPCLAPWEHSDMMEFFLEDAELFFARNTGGQLDSGIWQEAGVRDENQALIAAAMITEGQQVIIIRMLKDDYVERARILQKAREHLLERRMLNNDLEMYKQRSRFDSLTNLHNRGTFMEALQDEIARATVGRSDLSLLLLDIDNFKDINDTYGHLTGDAVLSSLGQLLRSYLRRGDMAARYGGEEFAIIAPYTMQGQAFRMAEKLRARIERHRFESLPPITVSIGCAAYLMGEPADSFIQRADLALYDAKRSGKNMVKLR